MCYYIEMDELAANSFIEAMNQNSHTDFISFSQMEEYGLNVVKYLKEENNQKAILIFSRNSLQMLLCDYSDLFDVAEENGESGLRLKEGVDQDTLIERFRGYLSLELMMAYINVGEKASFGA